MHKTTFSRGLRSTGAALLLGLGSNIAFADCSAPALPAMPDGATASMEQMLEGQKAVKAFQTANMDYMKCLEKNFEAAKENAKDAGEAADRAIAESEYATSVEAYNAAVSAEEEVAGAFNIALRAYRAANPK